MKHLSDLGLGSASPDHRQQEEMSGSLFSQRPVPTPRHIHPQLDFAQLFARYKRAGYEAVEHWEQTQRVNK
ncbi:hypothetical protein GCM10028819_32640 [Spirosoma humi]